MYAPHPSNSEEAKRKKLYTNLIDVYNKLKADGIIVDTEDEPTPSV